MSKPSPAEAQEIYDIARRLDLHSPLRLIAEELLAEPGARPAQIEPLFSALTNARSLRWRQRSVAAWCLGRAELEPIEREAAAGTLLRVLEGTTAETSSSRWGRAWLRYLCTVPVAMPLDVQFNSGPVFMMLLLPIVLGVSVWHDTRANNTVGAMAAAALGRLRAPESVGALARALRSRSPRIREAAASALHEVLPALGQEHLGLYDRTEITHLAQALQNPDNLLVFKVLEALEKVGTSAAIPHVEALLGGARMARTKEMAVRTLDVLRERQKLEQQGKTLLRAVGAPSAPSEILVRPGQGAPDTASEVVLRVAQGGGEDTRSAG